MIKSQKLGSKASDNPFAGKVKQSGNLKYENPDRKFYQKKFKKQFIVLTADKIVMFNDMEAVGKKKPEHIIKVNRFSSIMDIDTHEKKSHTFAVKVYEKKKGKKSDEASQEAVTHWFVAENEELRQKWLKAISFVIEMKKEGQTVLHLQMVKSIQDGDTKNVLKCLHEGIYSKNAFIQYANAEENDSQQDFTLDDDDDEEDDENENDEDDPVSTISDKERKQILGMGYVEGDTILHISIKNGQYKVVKSLLERKCDISIKNKDGDTVMHSMFDERAYREVAITPRDGNNQLSPSDKPTDALTPRTPRDANISPRSRGLTNKTPREEVMELLLTSGVINVDTQNNAGWTPLALAAKNNDYSLASALLYKDASPDIATKEGSPLHFAIKNCNLKLVEALLKKGSADPNITDEHGYTPLDRALERFREPEMVKIISALFAESNPKVNVNHPDTELVKKYVYVFSTHADVFGKKGVRLLDIILESHPDYATNEYLDDGVVEVPLIQAIKNKHLETAEILLKYNAEQVANKPELRADGFKYYPLHVSMMNQLDSVTELLLKNGASCDNKSGRDQVLPMLHAVQFKVRQDLAELIVEKSMENPDHKELINAPAQHGYTILYFAGLNSGEGLIKSLISKGADKTIITEKGESLLCAACYGGNVELVRYLVEQEGFDPKGSGKEPYIEGGFPPLHCAAKHGHVDVIKYLVEQCDVDINLHRHELHMRPIHLACLNGKYDAANYLLESACDITATIKTREDAGITCLHLAAGYGFPEIVGLLLDHGFDIMQRTEITKSSPLDFALRRNQLNVVKCLCERGSISDSVTLQLAVQTGSDEVLKWVEDVQEEKLSE